MDGNDVRPGYDVESAIARVLEAEHAARLAVDTAGVTATELDEAARAEVRAVAVRTERRIRRVRSAFEQETAAAVTALEAAAAEASARHDLGPGELTQLDAAVAALAIRLTVGAP